jgi:hypothetical protein
MSTLMSVAGRLLCILHLCELAGRRISGKKTQALRRGLGAMKTLKARCMSALDPSTPS